MKAFVTILFSLALVLSHLPAFASPVRQLCKNQASCHCDMAACCMKVAGNTPAPKAPAPAQDNSRVQLLAALQTVSSVLQVQPQPYSVASFVPSVPSPADVPLFIRNCSYLI